MSAPQMWQQIGTSEKQIGGDLSSNAVRAICTVIDRRRRRRGGRARTTQVHEHTQPACVKGYTRRTHNGTCFYVCTCTTCVRVCLCRISVAATVAGSAGIMRARVHAPSEGRIQNGAPHWARSEREYSHTRTHQLHSQLTHK